MKAPELKQYSDYRAFLAAHVQACKKRNKAWTYGVFAKQLGLKDPSSITKIIQGQREPGTALTGKLIKYFKFSGTDAQYFQDLIRLRKIKDDPRLAMMILEKVGSEHHTEEKRELDARAFMTISKWYCLVIAEMARLDDFVSDPQWITEKMRFKVTLTEAAEAIELLINIGMLKRVEGRLEVVSTNIRVKPEEQFEAARRHFQGMLDVAKIALNEVAPANYQYIATTLSMKQSRIPEACEFVRDCRERFIKIFHEKHDPDFTAEFMMQFFPMTHFEKKQSDTKE